MNLIIDHVGWVTKNIILFEKFWCNVIGYSLKRTSVLQEKMSQKLFNAPSGKIRRYSKEGSIDIEIHCFKNPVDREQVFHSFGINHVCFHTGEKGSRQEFLDLLPIDILVDIYDNPKGWQNIFVRDYERNWVELREEF